LKIRVLKECFNYDFIQKEFVQGISYNVLNTLILNIIDNYPKSSIELIISEVKEELKSTDITKGCFILTKSLF
jgi:hypothetical protein